MKPLNFTDPQGRTLTVNSPDNSIPTEAELDRMFSIKYGQPSVSSQGLSYVKEHPFKTALQPLAQTLTGKSFQERALEATAPKELPVRQIGRTAIGPTEKDFTGQFLKQALAGMAGSAADIATTPASYVPIPGAQFAGKIPVGSTTVGRIAKNIAVRPGFVKGVSELQRMESVLQQSGKLSSRGIPVTAAPLDVRSTNTIWGLYNEIAGTKFKKVSDVTQAKPQRVTAMRTISENLNDVKLPNPQTGELETRIPATRLELLDAFRQTKSSVWQKVNQLSSGATEKQAQIDLPKLAQQALQKTKSDIGDVALTTDKTLLTALEETVDRIRKSGVISPTKSEAYMKFLNNEIQRLRNSGQAVDFSVKDLYSNLLHGLNEATDQAIESALGTSGYRTFRNQYASLKSAEKELLGAANSFIKQTSGRLGGVTHPIANLWALEEFLKGTGQIAMGNVAGGVKSIGQGVLAKTAVRILDHFRLPDRKISDIFQTISKAKTLPIKETFTPEQTRGMFPFPEGPTTYRRPQQGSPQLPYSTKQLPYLGHAPYKPTGYPGGSPPQKPLVTPYQGGGPVIRGQAPYRGTTLPAISPQPTTPKQPLNLEQLRKSLQRKTQGQPLRGKHEVSPEQFIELPPRQNPLRNKSGQAFTGGGQENTPQFKNWFGTSKVVDESGKPLVVYSGHGNSAIYGNKYSPQKGTAGGFYATEDPKVASNYALGKFGNMEMNEGGKEYAFRDANGNYTKKLSGITLTDEQLSKLEKFKKLSNEYGDNEPIAEMDRWIEQSKKYDKQALKMSYTGGSKNLQNIHDFYEDQGYTVRHWAEDRSKPEIERFRNSSFDDLLDYLGFDWTSHWQPRPGVMPVYLNIKNPLDANKPFPKDLLQVLKNVAARERTKEYQKSAHWTKEYSMKEWVKSIEDGNEYWSTQIPEKAIPIIKKFGYDGIKEIGMKGSNLTRERRQINWIAFDPGQIKSSIGNKGTFDPKNKNITMGILGPTAATGIGLAAALKTTAARGETGESLDPKYKQQIANAENYGKTTGDWAQVEDIVIRDLKRIGKLKQNITLEQVRKDPQLYDKVVKLYWDRLDAFGIPEKDKALWWLMPGRYRQTGGDISRLKNPEHRNIMRNRVKNIGGRK